MEGIGWAITIIAVTGVVLNNCRRSECFWLWLVSNGLSAVIHEQHGMTAFVVRDLVFFALAIHGLQKWKRHDDQG